ncbi:MAG: mechanosensitive ion channel domain-containing protein, partial [Geminicoccaceae bacterium]
GAQKLVQDIITGVFIIAVSRPTEGLPLVLGATVQSMLAIAVGASLVVLIGRSIEKGVTLPSSLRSSQPQLSRRLDRIMPHLLNAARLIVSVAVALTVIDAFGIVDIGGWLRSESGETLIGVVLSVALVLILAYLIWLGLMSWIEYRLSDHRGHVAGARERTLLSLFANAITIALAAIAVMLVLSELGIEIGPLLAGAGVVGLAIGFGAQKLVQDIITGVFIQFENAINTDDVVTVAGTTGVVERLSIRSIGLRDVAGTYHLIPFSAVDQVSNYNRGFAYHIADIGIGYTESVPAAKEAMQVAFDRLKAGEFGMHLLGDLEMLGVQALGDSAVVLRGRLRTAPGQQWGIGRAYNELVKEVFDERGIDIPFPHMTLFLGTDKEGRTQLDSGLQTPA